MGQRITLKAPDLAVDGQVEVIEVLVTAGDEIAVEQSLLTLESEKASMEIPSTHAGKVVECLVKVGDKISSFDAIFIIDAAADAGAGADATGAASTTSSASAAETGAPNTHELGTATAQTGASGASASAPPSPHPSPTSAGASAPDGATSASSAGALGSSPSASAPGTHTYDVDVLVIGSGPGGYTAAFRAADLGLKVCMIERYPQIGGVCLNVGCIPSKALLHTARVLDEASAASHMGVQFGSPKIELDRLRQWKNGVTTKLNKGLAGMAKQRKVNVLTGRAVFASDHSVRVEGDGGSSVISFANAIIACGSRPIIPGPLRVAHEALIDSTGALELRLVPPKMLIVGGGIIGLEMATVYRALGSEITVVEMSEQLIPEADTDVVKVLDKRLRAAGVDIRLATSVVSLAAKGKQLQAQLSGTPAPTEVYDSVLVATGRAPNGLDVGAEHAGVTVDERGYIPADLQMRTNVGHIFSIGDVRGQPMLAHKATHEGKLAAEIIAGATNAIFDARCIPAVAYTDPELAWAGLSEKEAKRQGIAYDKAVFPFAASGRALSMDRTEGMTKLLFSRDTSKHLLGAAIVGPSAGDLIAEVALALEMGATAEDLAMTIHAHPTLSESINFAAEIAEGTITDLYLPRR